MITLLVLFCVLFILTVVGGVMAGIIAISPILVIVLCLPLIDYVVIKLILKKKKDKKNKEK